MNLVTAATSLTKLRTFIESDLKDLLSEIELNAAAEAVKSADLAIDKRGAYRSAITHLETVESVLKSQLSTYNRTEAAQKYIYVSGLKASILKYLGEELLVQKCCDDTLAVIKIHNLRETNGSLGSWFRDLASSWNPGNWFKLYRFLHSTLGDKAREFNAQIFWKEIARRDDYFELFISDGDLSSN